MRKPLIPTTEPYSIWEFLDALNNNDLLLTYTEDDTTKTFCTHEIALDILKRFNERYVLVATTTELTKTERRAQFLALYTAWWSRRKEQFGRLMSAFALEYDPLSNYDRREEGKIIDTHEIGARSGTDDLTDTYANTERTITETPRVEDTVTVEPNLTDTTTDTPRVVTTTTTAPGVSVTTAESYNGDNSSTAVPVKSTTVTPNATTPDIVTVEPTDGTNVSELVRQGTETTITSHDGINTTTIADITREDTHNRSTSSEAATDTDTHEFDGYRVFGNIGVTSNVQLLTGEFELRGAIDLITHALVEFVDLVSVYI